MRALHKAIEDNNIDRIKLILSRFHWYFWKLEKEVTRAVKEGDVAKVNNRLNKWKSKYIAALIPTAYQELKKAVAQKDLGKITNLLSKIYSDIDIWGLFGGRYECIENIPQQYLEFIVNEERRKAIKAMNLLLRPGLLENRQKMEGEQHELY